ncbi:MAG: hypothetical protein C0501_00595 [Isosphaera sp.]|nr:hypothetical protein [Isosphaera sp.]
MLAALTLSAALGAPVPAPAAPVPTGPAPQVMELKAGADGKVMVVVRRMEKVQVGAGAAIGPNGAPPAVITAERAVVRSVELGEVKDLTVTTADGKKVATDEAIKRIAAGAVVVVSADGKPVSPAFLKVFKDDTLVLASPELGGAAGGFVKPGIRPLPGVIQPQPGIQILPVQPGNIQILPAAPGGVQVVPLPGGNGVIQIQVAPGGVLPAVPPQPEPAPAPEKNEK